MASQRITPRSCAAALLLAPLALACAGGEVVDDEDSDDVAETGGTETGATDSTDDNSDESGSEDEPTCTELGCACDGGEGSCDAGLGCVDGTCVTASCGNGVAEQPAEQCDDGNELEGDGCDNDCSWTTLVAIDAGRHHTCALIESGRLRCWGLNGAGQLGYGNLDNIGDNELPSLPGDVVLGAKVEEISIGGNHGCARLIDGAVRCWGAGADGQLGYGNTNNVGDDEFPFAQSSLNIDAEVTALATGGNHSCALVGAGNVRCWGRNDFGQLGYGNTTPLTIPLTIDLNLGALALLLRAGEDHSCAVLDDGKLRCWGRNDFGQLGYGNTTPIGDNETPGSVVPVPLLPQGIPDGTPIIDVGLGEAHTCVLFDTGATVCWGDNFYGQLGQGNTNTVGDNETLATLFPIELGGDAIQLALGKYHTCALLEGGDVKCWGRNLYGQLGSGDIAHLGDDEVPADIDPIELGGAASMITAGAYHTCALVDGHEVVCWGFNDFGQLGYGDTVVRGDDEVPAEHGPISLL